MQQGLTLRAIRRRRRRQRESWSPKPGAEIVMRTQQRQRHINRDRRSQ